MRIIDWRIKMPAKIVTQDARAVKSLIEFITGKPCKEMSAIFPLADGAQLTKSRKGDAYYTTTANDCSCPGFAYHRTCKHVKSLQSRSAVEASREQARAYQARQRELREKGKEDASEAMDSIRPSEKWAGGYNGPVLEVA